MKLNGYRLHRGKAVGVFVATPPRGLLRPRALYQSSRLYQPVHIPEAER